MATEAERPFEERYAAWATGVIDEANFAAFQQQLLDDPACRRRFRQACREESALYQMLLEHRHRQADKRTAGEHSGRQPWRSRLLALAAGLLLGFGLLGLLRWSGVETVAEQTASLAGHIGRTIVATDEPQRLVWNEGASELHLEPGGALQVLAADAVDLQRGQLTARIASQPPGQSFTVRSAEAETRVLGTRFTVARDQAGTRVQVLEGRVAVTGRQTGVVHYLSPGDRLVIPPGP